MSDYELKPSHHLYLLEEPRPDFAATLTADEKAVLARHSQYFREQAAKGLVLLAGPALDNSTLSGITVLDTDDLAVAEAFRDGDPAFTESLLKVRIHPWLARVGTLAK